jgi:hypothetical protein
MNHNTNTPFVLQPGQGFVFYDKSALDARTKREQKAVEAGSDAIIDVPQVALFSGHLMLPGHKRVRIELRGIDRKKIYEASVRQLPQDDGVKRPEDWKELATFSFPFFGTSSVNYADTELKINDRSYKLRIIRDVEEGRFILRMPQVVNPARARSAMK